MSDERTTTADPSCSARHARGNPGWAWYRLRLACSRAAFGGLLSVVAVIGSALVPAWADSPHALAVTDVEAVEGNGAIVFTVTRERATGRAVSVAYRTVDVDAAAGADYEYKSGTVTLGAHQSSVTVAVQLLDDALDEPNETFRLHLTPIGGGVSASRSSAVGTIVDNDEATGGSSGEWTAKDLGTPGRPNPYGYDSSEARAITGQGRVAGFVWSQYSSYAFIWHADNVEASFYIGGTARGAIPKAEDINTHGQLVGSKGGEPYEALLWENGAIRDLGTPFDDPSYNASAAKGINDAGQIVGTAGGTDYLTEWRAFRWENGTFTDLGDLGGSASGAEDINALGQIVGESETASGDRHAFLWQQCTMTDLGTLGGPSSSAMAINDLGQVVGASQTASGEWHAFLWQHGTMTDLGTLGGGSGAYDINNGGQVVGTSDTAAGEQRAVVWDKGTTQQLPDLDIDPPAGFSPNIAFAINDTGQVVGASRGHAVLWS